MADPSVCHMAKVKGYGHRVKVNSTYGLHDIPVDLRLTTPYLCTPLSGHLDVSMTTPYLCRNVAMTTMTAMAAPILLDNKAKTYNRSSAIVTNAYLRVGMFI